MFSLFIYIVFPNEESIEVFYILESLYMYPKYIIYSIYVFLRKVFSTNRSRNVRTQYSH